MRRLINMVIALLSLPAMAVTLTLEQCIDTALVNSLQVKQEDNQYEMARLSLVQQKAAISPMINGNVGQGFGFGRSEGLDNVKVSRNSLSTTFNLSGSITIFDGLAMKYRIDEAKAKLNATEADREALQLSIRLNVSSMYLQVLLAKKQLDAALIQLEDTRSMLHRDSALVLANRKAEGELLSVLAQEASNRLSVQQSESSVQLALLDLAQAIDLRDFSDFDVEVPTDEELMSELLPDNETVYEQALQNRPELRSLQHQISASETALKRSKSAYSPTIGVSAGVGSTYMKMSGMEAASFNTQIKDNYSANVNINMSVPLYDRLQTPLNVKMQTRTLENTRLQLEEKKKSIRKEIDQAYYNARNAYAESLSSATSEARYEEALRYARSKYEAGRSSIYEYTNAQNNYQSARLTNLRAQYTYLFRLRILKYYQGE